MKNSKLLKIIGIFLIIVFFPGKYSNELFAQNISVFYSLSIPQHEFAANDIRTALEGKGYEVELTDLTALTDSYEGRKVVIALAGNTDVSSLLANQGGGAVPALGEQAYALRTTSSPEMSYWVLGGDDNGAMYGGLQIAEYINFNGYAGSYNEEDSPYLKYRGIKFNIPLDKDSPTYFYNNGGDSHKLAIRDVWDFDFWKTWFDEMARNRYNVLSLWSPHPFTSMLNMEDEYSGIAILGVTGYDENGNQQEINNMTIDQKVEFWKQVMEYGRNRGFGIYFCTWNIFLSTAEGKHGLSDSSDDQETRIYLRKCMKEFLETYPDLSGFGITVGERMGDISNRQKEEWAWDTYGKGMLEYAQANPGRDLVFIHRQHQGNISDILEYFQPLIDVSNVRFDLSFKYSQAHAHAAVKPSYWNSANMEGGLGPNNLKSWLTVRNDDFYFLHWADPQFVRDYVNNFPKVGKYVDAFYIGADGWVFTSEFTSKDPYYRNMNALNIQKTWYMQKLWGRISYNPSVSDELFKNYLTLKYPEAYSEELFNAWNDASRAILLANEQVTGTWDLDFKWWPETWTANDGFKSLNDLQSVNPMKGSNLCNFIESAAGNCSSGKVSAYENANEIEQLAETARDLLAMIDPGANKELLLTINNLQAMTYLSLYSASKFRAALAILKGENSIARDFMGQASCYWNSYTDLMDKLFYPVDVQRNYSFGNSSWHFNDAKVLKEYQDLGGTGEPTCVVEYPWIEIASPENGYSIPQPADVIIQASADAGENAIDRVEFSENDTLVFTDTDAPFTHTMTNFLAGNYKIEARVFDNLGATDYSSIQIEIYDSTQKNTVPWIEDFSYDNGTVEALGLRTWSATRPGGIFQVLDGKFIVNSPADEGVFTSGVIDISRGAVNVSMQVTGSEGLDASGNYDYVKLYRRVDGGPEILIDSVIGMIDGMAVLSEENISGNTLQLIIRGFVTYSTEYYYMDSLSVNFYGTPKQLPDVNITSPVNGTIFAAPASVTIDVEASDPDGTIEKLELKSNGDLLGTIINSSPPYSFSIPDLSAGRSIFEVKAYDNDGLSSLAYARVWSKYDQLITFPELTEKTYGDMDFDPVATSSSGLKHAYSSSNNAVATIVDGKVHIVGAGETDITAHQYGDDFYNEATAVTQKLIVNKADQSISFPSIPEKTMIDPDFILEGAASSGLALAYSISNPSVASIENSIVHILESGEAQITATQSGNTNYNEASNVSQTLRVIKADQTITFPPIPDKFVYDESFYPDASSSSGLTLSFVSSDTTVARIFNGKVHIAGDGITNIGASQAGNTIYNAASEVSRSLTVKKVDQIIIFPPIADKILGDEDFDPGATSSSGLVISYASSDTAVARIVNQIVQLRGQGNTLITASQGGNEIYNSADDVSQTMTVSVEASLSSMELDLKIYPNPAGNVVYINASELYSISLISMNGIELTNRSHLFGECTLDLSNLIAGVYFIKVKTDNSCTVRKLIINN